MELKIKKLHCDAIIPTYATEGASGFDLHALESVLLRPGETKLIRTGLAVEISPGYELQVRPRSGMSLKTPLRVANSPGTVDSDFRGELCVLAWHSDPYALLPLEITKGDRIAQGVISPVIKAILVETDDLSDTDRGEGGFGSSGQ